MLQVLGQLTARGADGKVAASYANAYGNRDTIFVFNQKETGSLSLQQSGANTFKWYKFNYDDRNFESFGADDVDVETASRDRLEQGGYKVTVTPQGDTAPRDSFVAWLYMNPGFEFELYKNLNGEVVDNGGYKLCIYTVFRLNTNTVQSSFRYYDPRNLQQVLIFDNKITYTMKPGNGAEVITALNVQTYQYFLDNNPPYEDTQYYFRAYDMFGIEKRDDVIYRTIIPYVIINQPVLPETDPASAPVPVKFTCQPFNVSEYIWRFGDGDSIVYVLPPDTVTHIFYTPRTQDYEVTVKVTSPRDCSYTSDPVKISVSPPSLEVANVFTPNNDQMNDYFKPNATSLRRFEIWIYTRSGKRVYYYRGDDLRSWEGWDGRIENTGKEAAEGVYFYTIKAYGWDEPSTKNPLSGPYHGSFHLYR
jgi:gliding motility-associated-like protein